MLIERSCTACGNLFMTHRSEVARGHGHYCSRSCARRATYKSPRTLPDPVGRRFGRWTVLARADKSPAKESHWLCRCDCGTERVVVRSTLRRPTASCGCWNREQKRALRFKHGCSSRTNNATPEYRAWLGMKARCYDPSQPHFKQYGGRGITVSERWRHDFLSFLADMGVKPSPKHSLDRIDPNGHYTPNNCRWATPIEQANNTRSNHLVTINGERTTVALAARATGLSRQTILARARESHDLDRDPLP